MVPDGAERHRLEMFERGEARRVVAARSNWRSSSSRFQERLEKRLQRGPRADHPGGDAIDAGIEEVERDVGAVEIVAADDFLHDGTGVVGEDDDVIAVPADAAADVQQDLVEPRQHGGDFVGTDSVGWKCPESRHNSTPCLIA